MNAPLYTTEILRLAASLPAPRVLERVDAAAEQRSPTCGSTIRTEAQVDSDGRIVALSQKVQACAFGQASAALLAAGANTRNSGEVAQAVVDLTAWLNGERDDPGSWPGLDALAPARSRKSRHAAILLPFRTLWAALNGAG